MGFFGKAFELCKSMSFIQMHDSHIKRMAVFEEFFKKNHFKYPK